MNTGDAVFICDQAVLVAEEFLRLALLPSTPIPAPAAPLAEDAELQAKTSLFNSARSTTDKASSSGTKENNSIKCSMALTVRAGLFLIYSDRVNNKRICNKIKEVILSTKSRSKYTLVMSNEDMIQPTDYVHPCYTNPTTEEVPVPLAHYYMQPLSYFSNVDTVASPASAKRRGGLSPKVDTVASPSPAKRRGGSKVATPSPVAEESNKKKARK